MESFKILIQISLILVLVTFNLVRMCLVYLYDDHEHQRANHTPPMYNQLLYNSHLSEEYMEGTLSAFSYQP